MSARLSNRMIEALEYYAAIDAGDNARASQLGEPAAPSVAALVLRGLAARLDLANFGLTESGQEMALEIDGWYRGWYFSYEQVKIRMERDIDIERAYPGSD